VASSLVGRGRMLDQLSNIIEFTISVNDFQGLWDERDLQNTQTPHAIKDARKIMKAVTVS
jgi:hypothetical protein